MASISRLAIKRAFETEAYSDLSAVTKKQYESKLYSLYLKIADENPQIDINDEYILEFFNDRKIANWIRALIEFKFDYANSSKTSLYGILMRISNKKILDYIEGFDNARNVQVKENLKQEMKPSRLEQLLTMAQIKTIHQNLLHRWYDNCPAYTKKIRLATDILMTGLMSGVYECCPPRRLEDYYEMKLHQSATEGNRFLENNRMIFPIHKNKKYDHAVVELEFPQELVPMLEWLRRIPDREYLLMNYQHKKMNHSMLHSRLRDHFGFGVDMLRSIFLSEKYKDLPRTEERKELAEKMGHSINMQDNVYIKKHAK